MAVERAATDLVLYALNSALIEEQDLNWAYNRVLECIGAPGPLAIRVNRIAILIHKEVLPLGHLNLGTIDFLVREIGRLISRGVRHVGHRSSIVCSEKTSKRL